MFGGIADEDREIDPVQALLADGLGHAETQGGNRIVSYSAPVEVRFWSVDQALKLIEAAESEAVVPQVGSQLLAALPPIERADRQP